MGQSHSRSGSRLPVRPGVRILVLLALLALVGVRIFGPSGGTARLTNAELAHLPIQVNQHEPRPVTQSAALACFGTVPAVTSVRSDGSDLTVRFQGVAQEMKIEFLSDENAAIRATNATPDQGNFYNNTIWLQAPTHLATADIHALGNCIPSGAHHSRHAAT